MREGERVRRKEGQGRDLLASSRRTVEEVLFLNSKKINVQESQDPISTIQGALIT